MWAAAEELESKISLDAGFGAKRSQFSGESSTPKIVGIHSKNAKELFKCHKYRFFGCPASRFHFWYHFWRLLKSATWLLV